MPLCVAVARRGAEGDHAPFRQVCCTGRCKRGRASAAAQYMQRLNEGRGDG